MNYLIPINMHLSFMMFTNSKKLNHTSPVKEFVISSLSAFSTLYIVFADDLH